MQPLSNAGIFLVALGGVVAGRPFVREFAEVGQPPGIVESDLFKRITAVLTWIWVAAFAGMTVSSAIPPIVQGDATILTPGRRCHSSVTGQFRYRYWDWPHWPPGTCRRR